jgi:hypothetical protein
VDELDFASKLLAELRRAGLSADVAEFACKEALLGAAQSPLRSVSQYQQAWLICHAAEKVLNTLDDGSKPAAWCSSLAQAIIDFEDAYKLKHGHMPLSPAPRGWERSSGSS